MANNQPLNAPIWEALRGWIDSREASERANGISELTPTQMNVISQLIAVEEKPTYDKRNYVAELNEYAQKRGGSVDYSREDHVPPANGGGGGGGLWRIYGKLSWCGQEFPQPGYGYDDGQIPPLFPSKRLAKQHAAKMALDYLHVEASQQAVASLAGKSTAILRPRRVGQDSNSSPPSKKAKTHQLNTTGKPTTTSDDVGVIIGSSKPSLVVEGIKRGHEASGLEDTQKSISTLQSEVEQLAARMNYKVPTYSVKPELGREGFFQGEAFWRKEPLAPEEPIRVRGVFGEAQAVEQLSAMVYEWLQKQGEQREADLAAIIGDIDPVKLARAKSG